MHNINLLKLIRKLYAIIKKTFIMKRQWAVEKYSLNLVGPGQGQRPPVFFYTTYRFENINISF